ncbi:FMN-dependent alpha-hydroxy acid dehydrogenase [Serendipita vermifera]|nr:FMN-dependent alpha-hydroxy acid dehydrogenase [Serendipita vermifera]
MLSPEECVGMIDVTTLPSRRAELEEQARLKLAREMLSSTAWAYYSSSAENEASHKNNLSSFGRYWFRPRVMRAVGEVDLSTTILGIPTSLPIFVSPAALAGLGHPEGEVNITRAVGREQIIQGISSNASRSIEDIAAAKLADQPLFFQLYLNKDREKSAEILRKVERLGFKAVMLTVDAPVLGKRERDIKNRPPSEDKEDTGRTGVAAQMDSYFEVNLEWRDITWIKSKTSLPVIIKGVQTVEDVELAIEHGAAGVLISNHGGRQLDYAPAPIDVLYELRQKRPDVFDKAEIYIDGGIRRGTDVLKALALGARAVGLGRPFLYANGTYGERGVTRLIRILEEELDTNMRLVGARKVSELTSEMVHKEH